MGFFSSLFFGIGGWSKEKLRDELLRLETKCAQSSWVFSDPRGVDAAMADKRRLQDRAEEIKAELKRRGLTGSESGAELMARINSRK